MYYKHSICHPENPEIEYPDQKLTAEQIRETVRKYPWKQELQKLKTLRPDEINYSPSVNFSNLQDHHSLCLTVEGEPDDFRFSVFYNRPVKRKVLFGLLREKVVMEVIDKPFNAQGAFRLLELFLKQEYSSIEKAYAFGE